MESLRLTPYARLPHRYQGLHMMSSTVDAYGRAHWLLAEHTLSQGRPIRTTPRWSPRTAVVCTRHASALCS